ncbi:MAG: hypothetical protein ACYDFU_08505 [Nitrospirota bacterium]
MNGRGWFGKHYLVSTVQLDSNSEISRLTRSIKLGVDFNNVPSAEDSFATVVYECNKDGIPKSKSIDWELESILFEREYKDSEQAVAGHEEIVELLAQGKLKL